VLTFLLLVAAILIGCWVLKVIAAAIDVATDVPMGLTYPTLILLVLAVWWAVYGCSVVLFIASSRACLSASDATPVRVVAVAPVRAT
jgi:hypothetical protein